MRGILHRMKAVLMRRSWERDVSEELRFHLEMETRKLMQEGLSEAEAHREAKIRLGGEELMLERAREERGTAFWDRTLQDLRFGGRVLLRAPVFTVVAVLTLALGIGGTVALFSVVQGLLLRPLPVEEEDQVVTFWFDYSWRGSEFDFARTRLPAFESVAAYSNIGLTLHTDQESLRIPTTVASAELFDVLGARPLLGQTFRAGDDRPGAERVIILSYAVWQQQYGGDPDIIGKRVLAGGEPTTVLGVMPREFYFPTPNMKAWMPLDLDPASSQYRNNGWLVLVGRVGKDVTEAQLQANLRSLGTELGENWDYPEQWDKSRNPFVTPLRTYLVGDLRPILAVLLGAVGMILVMACVNVAALLLVRSADRIGEMSLRTALGAGRGRLARQVLTESLLLGLLAGGVGVSLAWTSFDVLVASLPLTMGLEEVLSLDWTVLVTGLVLALASGSLIALVPIRRLLRGELAEAGLGRRSQGGVTGRGKLHASLVVSEVLLSVVLASGAALLIRTVDRIRNVEVGLDPVGVLAVDVSLPPGSMSAQERAQYFDVLVERTRSLPGVSVVGLINRLPVRDGGWQGSVRVEDRPELDGALRPNAYWRAVTPDAFEALGVELVEGRGFESTDRGDAPQVAVVNETFARRMWGEESPLGRRIGAGNGNTNGWAEVVGVVRNVAVDDLVGEVPMARYFPWDQGNRGVEYAVMVLKTGLYPTSLTSVVRNLVREVDSRATVGRVETMSSVLDQAMAEPLRLRFFLGLFSILGIVLGTVGVYGIVSFGVQRRRSEMGIRLALGAEPFWLLREVVGGGMIPVLLGVGGGLVVSLLTTTLLAGFLYGVEPTDPVSLGAAGLALLSAGGLATLIPASRAARIHPATALRGE
jgi:putative ABC transport system permease protein